MVQPPFRRGSSLLSAREQDLLLAVIQEAVHHIDVNVSELMMLERLWNGADDRKSQCLPERNGARIRAYHEVELHGFVAGVSCLAKAVMPERCACTGASSRRVNHERGICNMRAEIALISPKLVHAKDPWPLEGNVRRGSWAKPIREGVLSGRGRRKCVRVTGGDDRLKDWPHGLEISFYRPANFHSFFHACVRTDNVRGDVRFIADNSVGWSAVRGPARPMLRSGLSMPSDASRPFTPKVLSDVSPCAQMPSGGSALATP